MARELSIEFEVLGSTEAEAAIARLANNLQRAGDSALVAAEKAEKFEKSYKEGSARRQAKAELDALVGATGKFGNAADDASKKIGVKRQALDQLTSTVLKFAAPAVLGAAIKHTLDWAGNLTDLSKSTGISTTSLQKFDIIGKQSGVTMEQVANAALQMSDRLAGGNKSAAQAIDRVGLNLGQLMSMSPDQALLEVAHAASQIHNPMERVAFLTDAVGKAGAKTLLPMLDDLNEKWKTTAGVISEDGVKSLDEAGDALTKLGIVGTQFLGQVLAPMVPAFTAIANTIGEFVAGTIPKLQGWFSNVIDGFMQVELAFRQFDDNMRNAGLADLDRMDPARAASVRQLNGLGAGGSFNSAQQARDRLNAYRFQPPPAATTGGMFGPAFVQPNTTSPVGAGRGPARVLPFVPRNLMGTSMASIFAMGNTPGSFNAGRLPFFSSVMPLDAGGSPISFGNGSGFAPTVGMNAPGAQGGGFMNFLKGRGGAIAGAGLSAITQMFGGKLGLSATGQGIGSLVGSFIPGLGPLGSALGGLAGGLFGKLFGGGDGKAIKGAMGGADFKQLQAEAERLGISMDKVFAAKKVKDFEKAVADVSKRIGEQKNESERVQQAMDRWGLTIEDMGTKFQQNKMNETALSLAQDFVDLGNAGADTTKLLEKMAPTLSDFIAKSKTMGTEVPREMQPVLQAAQKAGLLFDENGEKLTDEAFASITWAQTMTQGFDKVESAINRLTEAILGMGTAFDRSADAASDFADAAGRAGGITTQPVGDAVGFASGGMAGRDFRRAGYGDVFPALLRRGETVLPAGVHRGGVSINGDIHVSGGYGSRSDAVEQIGEAVVKYMERRGARLVA